MRTEDFLGLKFWMRVRSYPKDFSMKTKSNMSNILSCQTVNFVAPTKINRRAHARYRASRCLRLNNIATTAKTSGQITLASGPTVPPVSHCDPFKVTLKRLCDGVNPLLGTP